MVLLLLRNDLPQGRDRFVIHSAQRLNLFMHVTKNHSFDGDSCSEDRLATRQSRQCAEHKPSEAAPKIASTPTPISPVQLGTKAGTMPALLC